MTAIVTGADLYQFITYLNGDAPIDATLVGILVDNAKAIIEEERPWISLRATDTSLTVSTSNTWQTPISIAAITKLSRFYGEYPLRIFDGVRTVATLTQVPFDRRVDYKDVSGTFCYDAANDIIYINGIIAIAGTLYINHIISTDFIDPAATTPAWLPFPSRFLPLLAYYSIGIFKGAIDYDAINRLMLPTNSQTMQALKEAFQNWDNALQLSDIEHNDPTDLYNVNNRAVIDRNG